MPLPSSLRFTCAGPCQISGSIPHHVALARFCVQFDCNQAGGFCARRLQPETGASRGFDFDEVTVLVRRVVPFGGLGRQRETQCFCGVQFAECAYEVPIGTGFASGP